MKQLFDQSPSGASQDFTTFRDSDLESDVAARAHIERMWTVFSPYADPQFPVEFSKHLDQRFWELYLGYTLLSSGHRLQERSRGTGPDFKIKNDKGLVWIEAIAPETGQNEHAIPPVRLNETTASLVPEREMILRLTNAFTTKADKLKEYLDESVVDPADILLVAISTCAWRLRRRDKWDPPYIARSLFGIGNLIASFEKHSRDITIRPGKQPYIKKGSVAIRTDYFTNDEYAFISGVVYSNTDPWNVPADLGSDFLTLRNPYASSPVSLDWPRFGHRYEHD